MKLACVAGHGAMHGNGVSILGVFLEERKIARLRLDRDNGRSRELRSEPDRGSADVGPAIENQRHWTRVVVAIDLPVSAKLRKIIDTREKHLIENLRIGIGAAVN